METNPFWILRWIYNMVRRIYQLDKYDVPEEINSFHLAAVKQSERMEPKVRGLDPRKEVLMKYKDDGAYVAHRRGDVVPVIPLDDGRAAHYRIQHIEKPTFVPSPAWDDNKKYDLTFHHVGEVNTDE